MRASVLDLGSNSFHVLVADLDAGHLSPVFRELEMLHLGRVVARHGEVPAAERARAVATARRLTDRARDAGALQHHAVATSALRDAGNGAEVIADLGIATGTRIRVLDGAEEARLGYLGVRAAVAVSDEPVLVLDLGGGSLELTVATGPELRWSGSLPLGGSRLSALVDTDPLSAADVDALRAAVDAELTPALTAVAADPPATTIAIGGSVRALAGMLARDRAVWVPPSLNQLRLPVDEFAGLGERLVGLDLEGRRTAAGPDAGRADHLHVAAIVLTRVLERLGVTAVTIADWGVREGLLLDAQGETEVLDAATLRRGAIDRLCAVFTARGGPDAGAERLAARLDVTAARDGLGARERELLVAAARLRTTAARAGLRPDDRADTVERAGLRGHAPWESAVLATLVRAEEPDDSLDGYPPFASLDEPTRGRTRHLLTLLRAAEAGPRPGLRPRYVRRVTPEHAGERVSIRHLVTDRDRGPVPTDVVGRLLAFEGGALLVVDRRAQLHVIDETTVVASRVVPPHPRLPAEPTDLGTPARPLVRQAARVLLLDRRDRVLLVSHLPGDGRRVWTAPGGGLRPDEDHAAAARRELVEELGLDLVPGPWVWRRRVTFRFHGVSIDQDERWFLARAELDPDEAPLDDHGTDEARWWTLDELAGTDEVLAPRALPDHLTGLLRDGPPAVAVDVGR
jgi:exopolyphosphatase / guanosine-5'-triphosphate,3'-diphosphate pyrophosphatase